MSRSKTVFLIVGIVGAAALFLTVYILRDSALGGGDAAGGAADSAASSNALPEDACASTACITFTGSTGVGDNFADTPSGSPTDKKKKRYFFEKVEAFLKRSQAVFTGLETPLMAVPEKPEPVRSNFSRLWSDSAEMPGTLKAVGVTAVSLANRHLVNFGEQGIEETVAALDEAGIAHFGLTKGEYAPYEPIRQSIPVGNKTFDLAVFAASEAGRTPGWSFGPWRVDITDPVAISQRIAALKKASPEVYVVVYLSSGTWYRPALKRQQDVARYLADEGADLVVTYGARAVQEIEFYKDKWLLYNLGNFVFTSRGFFDRHKETPPFGAVLRLVLKEQGRRIVPTLKLYPLSVNNLVTDYQVRFVTEKEFQAAYESFFRRGEIEYDEGLKQHVTPDRDINGPYLRLSGAR